MADGNHFCTVERVRAADVERLRREDLVLSMIPRSNFVRVLHLGCGDGSLTVRLPGRAIVGLDADAMHVEAARSRWPENGRFTFSVADALTLSDAVGADFFDLAVLTNAFAPAAIGLTFPVAWAALAERVRPGGFVVYDREDDPRRPPLPARRLDRLLYVEGDRVNLVELYRL